MINKFMPAIEAIYKNEKVIIVGFVLASYLDGCPSAIFYIPSNTDKTLKVDYINNFKITA